MRIRTYAWGLPEMLKPTRKRRNNNQLYTGAKVLSRPKYRMLQEEMIRPCFTQRHQLKPNTQGKKKTSVTLTILLPYLSQKIPQTGQPIPIARNTICDQKEKSGRLQLSPTFPPSQFSYRWHESHLIAPQPPLAVQLWGQDGQDNNLHSVSNLLPAEAAWAVKDRGGTTARTVLLFLKISGFIPTQGRRWRKLSTGTSQSRYNPAHRLPIRIL